MLRIVLGVVAVIVVLFGGGVGYAQPAPSPSPGGGGKVYQGNIFVRHKNGDVELVPMFLVRWPDDSVVIVDKTGQSYHSLRDFQENNRIFTDDDVLTLPKDFPNVREWTGRSATIDVPGHISPSHAWLYWVLGGVLVGIVMLFWVAVRWRAKVRASYGFDDSVSTLQADEYERRGDPG